MGAKGQDVTTVIEPSTTGERPRAFIKLASDLCIGEIVTNIGVVDAVNRVGVFVVASIRGTVWSLASGKGDIANLDVVWHETQQITVDLP